MYDELTEVDIKKMPEELDHRIRVLRPELIEAVQTARAFGDLSENFEYKCAKQAKNRNESRIRYLQNMIRTAKVIEVKQQENVVSLFDTVVIYNEMVKKEMTIRIVTTLRQDALKGLKSAGGYLRRELGSALNLRYTPELQWALDDSITYGARMLKLINSLEVKPDDEPEQE